MKERVTMIIAVAALFTGQSAGAWAYQSSSSDTVIGVVGAAVFVVAIIGIVLAVLKLKQNHLKRKMRDLAAKYPGFTEKMFVDNVSRVFWELCEGWVQCDIESVRPFLSSVLFSSLEARVQEHIQKRTKPCLGNLSLDWTEVYAVRSSDEGDKVVVWLKWKAKDYVIDEQGRKIAGSLEVVTKDDKWTFARPRKTIEERNDSQGRQAGFDWILVEMSAFNPLDTTLDPIIAADFTHD